MFRYAVLGAGRQGLAAAFDLARFGDAESVVLADASFAQAQQTAARVNELTQTNLARAAQLDVTQHAQVVDCLKEVDAFISAVPYYFNPALAEAALEAHTSMCDLGGNTDIVWQELALDERARRAGISIVPDCGVGPGLMTNLAVYAIEQLDRAREVYIYDGGLPAKPRPPLNYILNFNVEGLTNEYVGHAIYLQSGAPVAVPCFDEREYELLDVPGLGRLEAFVTSGGLSTLTHTYAGRLDVLKNKTLRYPGHAAVWKGLADLGLLDLEPVRVDGTAIAPRRLLHQVVAPKYAPLPGERDLVVIHIAVLGEKQGRAARVQLDVIDYYDDATGFSAMQRLTGFHAAIVCAMMARGEIPRGAQPLERAVNAERLVEALPARGIQLQVTTKDE
jgi:lysine 6-dehydrogenase